MSQSVIDRINIAIANICEVACNLPINIFRFELGPF